MFRSAVFRFLTLLLFLRTSAASQDSVRLNQDRLTEIVFSVLDTLRAEPDSSSFSNPLVAYPLHFRTKWELQLIKEGYAFPPASALYKGIDMATTDLLRGRLCLKYSGEMIGLLSIDSISWLTGSVYAYNLKSKFGISLESVPSGPGFKWYNLYVEGYNRIAVPVLDSYFGCAVRKVSWNSISDTIRREGQYHRDEWISQP